MGTSNRGARVLLVGSEDEENLSIRYLGGALKEHGHTVKIAPCSRDSDIRVVIKTVKDFKPDLIGISMAFQSLARMFFRLVVEIRDSGYRGHITVGGHFPTFEYRKILETQPGIDSVVRFEGERPIVELAEFCVGKRELDSVTNLVYRSDKKILENKCVCRFPDLDSLAYPVREKKPMVRLGEKFATLVASRGCWHSSCLYCCIGAFHSKKEGSRYALRSPESIAKEIAELYHDKGVRLFQFHDDNFMMPSKEENLQRFGQLKRALERNGVDFSDIAFLIKARPDSVNEEVVSLLEEMGVVGVFLGIENASETGLKSLIRGSKLKDVNNALGVFKNHKMSVTYNLLIFHPNATLDEINQNIVFMKNHLENPFDFGRAEIVAGSPLETQIISEGLLRGQWPNWDYRIKDKAVERMFLINVATFRKKGSNYSRLMHHLIALSYRAYVVDRLYPGPSSEKLLSDANGLIRKSNKFIFESILGMYRLTASQASENDVDALFKRINSGCAGLLRELIVMSKRMDRLQSVERRFKDLDVGRPAQSSGTIKKLMGI